jgi:hypothetical protein
MVILPVHDVRRRSFFGRSGYPTSRPAPIVGCAYRLWVLMGFQLLTAWIKEVLENGAGGSGAMRKAISFRSPVCEGEQQHRWIDMPWRTSVQEIHIDRGEPVGRFKKPLRDNDWPRQ